MNKKILRLATRKSKLALWQANWVKNHIEKKYEDLTVELIGIVTEGDLSLSVPLTDIGGKSVFVKTLQNALLTNQADIAVHCVKDMSVHPVDGLTIAAICEREDPRDAFISINTASINELKPNPIIGTASPRRESLLKSLRPDAKIKLIRGNVGTRLSKLEAGEYDAIILAAAGLHRLDLHEQIREYLSPDVFIPAIGQGALAIECRSNDLAVNNIVSFLNDEQTAICVEAEKAVNQQLQGDCHTPIGAYAKISNGQVFLDAMVGSLDGKIILRSQHCGNIKNAKEIGTIVADDLLLQGANKLLKP